MITVGLAALLNGIPFLSWADLPFAFAGRKKRAGGGKPFEKGLSQNFKQINSQINPNLLMK